MQKHCKGMQKHAKHITKHCKKCKKLSRKEQQWQNMTIIYKKTFQKNQKKTKILK